MTTLYNVVYDRKFFKDVIPCTVMFMNLSDAEKHLTKLQHSKGISNAKIIPVVQHIT